MLWLQHYSNLIFSWQANY